MTVTYIVPTTGRSTLQATLQSIECWPGDEILLVSDGVKVSHPCVKHVQCPAGQDWGHSERNFATPMARGRYIAHIDDDDVYAPGTRRFMADAMRKNPGQPVMFRMRYNNGIVLWREQILRCGNVGTPMFLMPNMPTKLGNWEPQVGGDFLFLESSKWKASEYVWRPEIIALLRPHEA